jgi:alpha-glucosidase (family GH31 glycosyl hydrolase)
MRTFIISRASYAGQGKYGSKWLGDNFSENKHMAASVTGSMMMNIFGIPFVGSDICGFIGNTNAELCARWYFVGAFQPFSRNHNNWGQTPQEPYVFANEYYEDGISYTDIIRTAMRAKLSLIRYYYSLFFLNSMHGGAPVYKPLFFDYPND